jgi:peptidoglycan/xylan/chitin deacetylase (PgdA/CDA1 family)
VYLLAYHLVDGGSGLPVDLDLPVFRRHLSVLEAQAEPVSLTSAMAGLESGGVAGLKSVLSFDDAFDNFYRKVWPVLAETKVPSLLFVPVGFLRGEGPGPFAPRWDGPATTWEHLREMVDTGLLTVGSHSWSHRDLRSLSQPALQRELRDSRAVLEDEIGKPVAAFCYPRGLWNRRVEDRVRESYEWAAVGGGRILRAGSVDPMRLSRLSLRRDAPVALESTLGRTLNLEELLADRLRRRVRRRGR